MQVKFVGFSIEKPTYTEKNSKKYKGGDWYVIRIIGFSTSTPGIYPTGLKGLMFSLFSFLVVAMIILNASQQKHLSLHRIYSYIFIFGVLLIIAHIKTYRRQKGAWTQFREARRYYKMRKINK